MPKRKSHRSLRYVVGSAFAVLISVCVGLIAFLVLTVVLPYFELSPFESVSVALGVGGLLTFVALVTQFWAFAIHDTLRPRRSAQISHRTGANPQ